MESQHNHSAHRLNKMLWQTLSLLLSIFFLVSCGDDTKTTDDLNQPKETLFSGDLTLLSDTTISMLVRNALDTFPKLNPSGKIVLKTSSARIAMARLLAGDARAIILARDYLHDEDSLMAVYKVQKHRRFHIATDALVFFAQKNFPIDTLNSLTVKKVFSDRKQTLRELFTGVNNPQIVCPDAQTSVYANVLHYLTNNKNIQQPMRYYSTIDSVKSFVSSNPSAIGIAYLSHIASDTSRFKMLKIGFYSDSTQSWQCKTVHQATVYRQLYPFPVFYIGYLLEDTRNFPYGVLSFLSQDASAQRSFLNAGIVPTYARIRLNEEE